MRVLYALTIGGTDNIAVTTGDRYFFVEGAKLLASGHGFVHPFISQYGHVDAASAAHPPLWIVVLAPLAKLGLLTYDSARVAACVMGAGAVAVVGLVAQRLAGERAGLIAAGIAALYPGWIVSDASGMSEALYVLLVASALLFLLDRRALLAGIAIGLAALTRTEALLLLPLVAWPLLWRERRALLTVTALAAVVVVPWTIRNAGSLDRFVPVSTNTETVIAGANCHPAYHGRDTGYWVPACLAVGPKVDLAHYDEGELADRWREAGTTYARDHLSRAIVVAGVRVLRTWRLWQPLREGQSEGENGTAEKIAALVFLLVLLPAAGLALWRGRPRRALLLIVGGLALQVTLTSAIGWGSPRFARPLELGLIVAVASYVAVTRWVPSGARPSRPT